VPLAASSNEDGGAHSRYALYLYMEGRGVSVPRKVRYLSSASTDEFGTNEHCIDPALDSCPAHPSYLSPPCHVDHRKRHLLVNGSLFICVPSLNGKGLGNQRLSQSFKQSARVGKFGSKSSFFVRKEIGEESFTFGVQMDKQNYFGMANAYLSKRLDVAWMCSWISHRFRQ
jgi:hypothetical protein